MQCSYYLNQTEQELKIRNYSPKTIKSYLVCLKEYLLYCRNDLKSPNLSIHKLLISLSYGAGLRVSEAINLKMQDIDLQELTIHLKLAKGKKDRITISSESHVKHDDNLLC